MTRGRDRNVAVQRAHTYDVFRRPARLDAAIWDTYIRVYVGGAWPAVDRIMGQFDRPNTHAFLLSPNQLGIIRVLIKLSFTHRSGVLTVSLAKTYCLTRLLHGIPQMR